MNTDDEHQAIHLQRWAAEHEISDGERRIVEALLLDPERDIIECWESVWVSMRWFVDAEDFARETGMSEAELLSALWNLYDVDVIEVPLRTLTGDGLVLELRLNYADDERLRHPGDDEETLIESIGWLRRNGRIQPVRDSNGQVVIRNGQVVWMAAPDRRTDETHQRPDHYGHAG
jgi:hypothetical protein